MGKYILSMLVVVWVSVGCSTTPEDHSKSAFHKYSLQCVARGLQEDTPAHTDCVVNKYGNVAIERNRSNAKMSELFYISKQEIQESSSSTNTSLWGLFSNLSPIEEDTDNDDF